MGTLEHACRIVKPGRAFLRRAIDLLHNPGSTKSHHHLRLNCEFNADLPWWKTFAVHWNGISMFLYPPRPAFSATLDASGIWGCGAWSGSGWFQYEWPAVERPSFLSRATLVAEDG